MEDISYDVKLNIADKLSLDEIAKLCQTSSIFSPLCKDEVLWANIFMKYYGRYMYEDRLHKWKDSKKWSWYECFVHMYEKDLHNLLPDIYEYINYNTDGYDPNSGVGIRVYANMTINYNEPLSIRYTSRYYGKLGSYNHESYKIQLSGYHNSRGYIYQVSITGYIVKLIDTSKEKPRHKLIPRYIINDTIKDIIESGKWDMRLYCMSDVLEFLSQYQDDYHKRHPLSSCRSKSLDYILSFLKYSDVEYSNDRNNIMMSEEELVSNHIEQYEKSCINKGIYTSYDNLIAIKGGNRGCFTPDVILNNIRNNYFTEDKDRRYYFIYTTISEDILSKRPVLSNVYVKNYRLKVKDFKANTYERLVRLYNCKGNIIITTRNNFSDRYYKHIIDGINNQLRRYPLGTPDTRPLNVIMNGYCV